MRLIALALTAILLAPPVFGQEPPASSPREPSSSPQDKKPEAARQDPKRDLPVSLDRIREQLAQPQGEPLKGLDERPMFRVEIRERQKLDDLVKSLKFNGGPPIPVTFGGVYGYEQQRLMFNPVDNPLAQPWSAFTGPQLTQVAATSFIQALLTSFLAKRLTNAITTGQRVSAEQAAREDVKHAIAEYCAAQPNHGANIRLCMSPDAIR